MADEPKLPAGNPGETGGTESGVDTRDAVDMPLLGSADPGEAGEADGKADKSTWPENWRELAAGDDKKALARFKRMADPGVLGKSYLDLERKMSAGQASGPPEGATDAEIAQYRKTAGIPEKADGYGLAFPETMKPTEADTAALTSWSAYAHQRHLTPAAAKAGAEFYAQTLVEAREAHAAAVQEAKIQGIAELRAEWKGSEFTRSMSIGKEFLKRYKAPDLPDMVLADGRSLGDHPDFVRFVVAVGRATADEEALHGGDGAGGGKSLEDEKTELVNKSVSKGLSKTEDARLNQIYEALAARDERHGRGRAA